MKIIRISAIWCPACIIMRPIYDDIVKKYGFETKELDYDFDEEVSTLDVGKKLPVAIVYDDNDNELTRICGEKKQTEIEKIIEGFK